MTAPKLTAQQLRVLRAAAAQRSGLTHRELAGFFGSGVHLTSFALMRLGLLERIEDKGPPLRIHYKVTKSGRATVDGRPGVVKTRKRVTA